MDGHMDMDVPINSLDTSESISGAAKGKRRVATIDLTEESKPGKPRTLGGDRPRDPVMVKKIGDGSVGGASTSRLWSERPEMVLPIPPLLTFVSAKVEGSEDVFEGRNSEDDGMPFLAWAGNLIDNINGIHRPNRGYLRKWETDAMAGLLAFACIGFGGDECLLRSCYA